MKFYSLMIYFSKHQIFKILKRAKVLRFLFLYLFHVEEAHRNIIFNCTNQRSVTENALKSTSFGRCIVPEMYANTLISIRVESLITTSVGSARLHCWRMPLWLFQRRDYWLIEASNFINRSLVNARHVNLSCGGGYVQWLRLYITDSGYRPFLPSESFLPLSLNEDRDSFGWK